MSGGGTVRPDLGDPVREVVLAQVTDESLDLALHLQRVGAGSAGAVVAFAGTVRNHDDGRAVRAITYVAHPAAGEVIARVAAGIAERFPVARVAVSHRVGRLDVGECALAVAVSAAHRREAFDAASELVEEVKRVLPVWKRQHFSDGTEEWVACT